MGEAGFPAPCSDQLLMFCQLCLPAVDCARVLLKTADDLAGTDICSHAVEQLRWVLYSNQPEYPGPCARALLG